MGLDEGHHVSSCEQGDALVFTSELGKMIDLSNLMTRVQAKRRRRAETWVGFHTFRHACATMLFRPGLNAKQVQVWLGHHSPAFRTMTQRLTQISLNERLPDAGCNRETTPIDGRFLDLN